MRLLLSLKGALGPRWRLECACEPALFSRARALRTRTCEIAASTTSLVALSIQGCCVQPTFRLVLRYVLRNMKCGASSGPRYPDRARYRSLRPTSTVAEAGLVRPHGRMLNADSNAMFAFASRSVATALKHAGDGHLPQLVVGRVWMLTVDSWMFFLLVAA